MSQTKHHIFNLKERFGGFSWLAVGDYRIEGRILNSSRALFTLVPIAKKWAIYPEKGGGKASADHDSPILAVEAWAWGHEALDLLGIKGDATRIAKLEAENERLRQDLGRAHALPVVVSLLLEPLPAKPTYPDPVHIYCHTNGGWWRANAAGYTNRKDMAGFYRRRYANGVVADSAGHDNEVVELAGFPTSRQGKAAR